MYLTFLTNGAVLRAGAHCWRHCLLPHWIQRDISRILQKTQLQLVFKDDKLAEWSVGSTDVLIQKLLHSMHTIHTMHTMHTILSKHNIHYCKCDHGMRTWRSVGYWGGHNMLWLDTGLHSKAKRGRTSRGGWTWSVARVTFHQPVANL